MSATISGDLEELRFAELGGIRQGPDCGCSPAGADFHQPRATGRFEDLMDDALEGSGELFAGDREDMLAREDAVEELARIGEFEDLLDVQHEMVELALADELGVEQQLAASAPQVRERETRDLPTEAQLKDGSGNLLVVL